MLRRSRLVPGLVAVVAVALGAATMAGCTPATDLARPEDPVVLQGSALPKLLGAAPGRVVGFAWDGSAWHQRPVQVDERDLVNPGQILNVATSAYATLPGGAPFKILAYTSPTVASPGYRWWATFTPPDSDPTVDGNDEVSFLATSTGRSAPADAGAPADVVGSTRQAVTVTDPLTGAAGYLYLFRSATLSGGSAGTTGVNYTFSLDSGDYRTTYHMGTGALPPNNVKASNPEHSTVDAPGYSLTYGDRWLNDGLAVKAGGSPGTDILERSRFQFAPGVCGRSEDTFDHAQPATPYEGAFIANISGPVRAVRSVISANSGKYTSATDLFYPQRQDSTVDLRVHQIPGVMAFDDYQTDLAGLTYRDDQNTAGKPINAIPDALVMDHPPGWQMVSGAPGSVVVTRSLVSDISDLSLSTYQLDQRAPNPAPCTGDSVAWGQSGMQATGAGGGSVACTDPTIYGKGNCPTKAGRATTHTLQAGRIRYFEAPNLPADSAAALGNRSLHPLTTAVAG